MALPVVLENLDDSEFFAADTKPPESTERIQETHFRVFAKSNCRLECEMRAEGNYQAQCSHRVA
jgi:hypothetical protein